MKITKSRLRQIIKEELSHQVISENIEKDGEFTMINRDDGKIVIVSNKVYDHIGTHAKPGKGSVFGGNITPDMINDKLMSENIPKTGGGIPVDFGSSNGYLLVAPFDVAMKLKGAVKKTGSKEDFDPKTKKMVPVPVAEVHTTQPITDFVADVVTMLVFPYDPNRSTNEQNKFVDNSEKLKTAKEKGRLYALATAFPGGFSVSKVAGLKFPEQGVPKATAWGGVKDPKWAVIIPDSGLKKESNIKITKSRLRQIIREELARSNGLISEIKIPHNLSHITTHDALLKYAREKIAEVEEAINSAKQEKSKDFYEGMLKTLKARLKKRAQEFIAAHDKTKLSDEEENMLYDPKSLLSSTPIFARIDSHHKWIDKKNDLEEKLKDLLEF